MRPSNPPRPCKGLCFNVLVEAGHWLSRWPEMGQKRQGRLGRGPVPGDTSNARHRWVVLTTFLEKGLLMPFMEEETEVQGKPKMLGSPRLARIKPVPTAIWVLSIPAQP